MKDIDPRFDARFDTIVYPPARKERPFWPVVVLVVAVCFVATLFWPKSKPAEPQPVAATGAPAAAKTASTRDVISIADPDLAQRRAQRDRAVAEQWSQSSSEQDVAVAPRRASGPRIFAGCNEARAAGRENIPMSDPAYHEDMDGDGDGLACEPIRPGRRAY